VPQSRLHRHELSVPGQGRLGEDREKMITVFGAPLTPEESAAIVAYLDRHYGK
jgi:hypothetical protein